MIKEIISKIKTTFNNNPMLFLFIIASLINSILLRVVTIKNYFALKPIFIDLALLLLIASFSFLIKKKNCNRYFLIMSIIMVAICIINSMYYTYYKSFASISLLATSTAIVDVGDAIVENVLQPKDFIFLWELIVVIYFYRHLNKNKTKERSKNSKNMAKLALSALIIFGIAALFVTPSEWSSLSKIWRREERVSTFGIYTYQVSDLFTSLQPGINNLFGHDQALKNTMDFFEEKNSEDKQTNEYTNIFKGKNVIVIHAESLQSIAINKEFDGVEVTPNLNKLLKEGIYFSNFYSQVGVGTSSDAEFTFATSLMPSSSGTVFINYYDREYDTIQKEFKKQDYNVYSMHGNKGTFWNRDIMHQNMGYDIFFSEESYVIDETIGLGLSDKSFFKQSISKIQNIKEEGKPYYITLLTLSNHTPFSDLSLMDEYDTGYLNGTLIGNYFRSVHYADQAMGDFINDLDKEGLLDNTVLVIYGDHDARIDYQYYQLMYNYDEETGMILTEEDEGYTPYNEYDYIIDKKVPFIIWTKDTNYNTEIDTPMGMIDVYPTLGNMFGLDGQYQIGNDIMNLDDNTVVFTDGSFITKKIYYDSGQKEAYPISGEAISDDYITKRSEYADTIIEISNNIITYDLIKEMEDQK